MTLEEAQLELSKVNSAISLLVAGKQLNMLQLGSGAFTRRYGYKEISLEELKSYRNELMDIINSYNQSDPTFRDFATIPISVRKAGR